METTCEFTGNNRLCGDGERVMGYTCIPCASKANCAANGECHNSFDSSDYFCSTCPGGFFDAGGSFVKCVGGAFGVVAPILLVLLAFVAYWVLKRRGVLKEHHLKHFNLNMDKQTKLKQTTTVVQVLSEASKTNNLLYPQ
ncbi:hypothetical protein TrLO_g13657 [Triparma laevis f. longispina]|uniref:Uncharacterized protein n=1 Tax=Triparma laevis f. longispina TaxID=1714387 RepID=A0A9W7E012_9STRA|nr:hypothetical protein TrLO_g13657 [Triparma laevis f. longispina]